MAKFDESNVINALHWDRAEVGKKYYCSDSILRLKKYVEDDDTHTVYELDSIDNNNIDSSSFVMSCARWQFLYPYEEPPKKRMTYRQLAEWLAKGNGEHSDKDCVSVSSNNFYPKEKEYDEVPSNFVIRSWSSDEWIEPTVDVYERDCK